MRRSTLSVLGAAALLLLPFPGQAPDQDQRIALAWHRRTGAPLDARRLAEASQAVLRASNFDKPDVLAAEEARLLALVDAANVAEEFTVEVNDHIGEYDHGKGEFSVQLFTVGTYLPIRPFGREYRVVFANAESARAIRMGKDEARAFDQRLASVYRRAVNHVRFRVIGTGDPVGAVTGERVIRAELMASRLVDGDGRELFAPAIEPVRGATVALVAGTPTVPAFDPRRADIAGLRVAGSAADLEATLTRLYGEVRRGRPSGGAPVGTVATLEVNSSGCYGIGGRRNAGGPGTVCIHAYLDGDDVVRMIRVERVFGWTEPDLLRRALVRKYGEVADARGSTWSWGEEQPAGQRKGEAPAWRALTAFWSEHDSYLSRGMNAAPQIKITLQLIDTSWKGGP